MKAAPFAYHDPANLDDLIGLLGTLEDVKLLAGGQSLMPMLNMRFSQPDHVIDLNGITGLAGISDAGGTLSLGAMTRQSTLLNSPDIATKVPVMQEALRSVISKHATGVPLAAPCATLIHRPNCPRPPSFMTLISQF